MKYGYGEVFYCFVTDAKAEKKRKCKLGDGMDTIQVVKQAFVRGLQGP
jgi:hypothetical protein